MEKSNSSSLAGRAFSAVEAFLSYVLPGALVAFMMFFITAEVVLRLTINHSFVGLVDIISLCVIILAFLSLSGIQRENSHIAMDLVPMRLSGKHAGSVLEFINLLILIAALLPLIYTGACNVISLYQDQSTTMTIYWPLWPAGIVIPLGCLLMCMRVGIQIWKRPGHSTSSETESETS
jgi:TRAP-type C4-dicarboxylate transport system permease small subunit